jgi:hypothetical protein
MRIYTVTGSTALPDGQRPQGDISIFENGSFVPIHEAKSASLVERQWSGWCASEYEIPPGMYILYSTSYLPKGLPLGSKPLNVQGIFRLVPEANLLRIWGRGCEINSDKAILKARLQWISYDEFSQLHQNFSRDYLDTEWMSENLAVQILEK